MAGEGVIAVRTKDQKVALEVCDLNVRRVTDFHGSDLNYVSKMDVHTAYLTGHL